MPLMTIRLSRQESARVARLAKKRNVTRSELVREAIADLDEREQPSALDAWRDVAGLVKSSPRDLSTNPKYLKGFGR